MLRWPVTMSADLSIRSAATVVTARVWGNPMRRCGGRDWMAVVALAVVTIGLSSPSAVAGSVQLTDDEMCDLTPPDGNWGIGPNLVDSELSILGTISYDDRVRPRGRQIPRTERCPRLPGVSTHACWPRPHSE